MAIGRLATAIEAEREGPPAKADACSTERPDDESRPAAGAGRATCRRLTEEEPAGRAYDRRGEADDEGGMTSGVPGRARAGGAMSNSGMLARVRSAPALVGSESRFQTLRNERTRSVNERAAVVVGRFDAEPAEVGRTLIDWEKAAAGERRRPGERERVALAALYGSSRAECGLCDRRRLLARTASFDRRCWIDANRRASFGLQGSKGRDVSPS